MAQILGSTLLLLLHHGPAHAYTLLEPLGEFGLEELDPSIIYRALHAMEEEGWVSSIWDEQQTLGPPRRVYSLTAGGDQVLQSWIHDLEETRQLIDRLVDSYYRHMAEGQGEHH